MNATPHHSPNPMKSRASFLFDIDPENAALIARTANSPRVMKNAEGMAYDAARPERFDVCVSTSEPVANALARCPPGGSVLVLPGVHALPPGGLRIDRSVHVFGSANSCFLRVVRGDGAAAVTVTASDVSLVGVGVVTRGDRGVCVERGRSVLLQGCCVRAVGLPSQCAGVTAELGGQALLIGCDVRGFRVAVSARDGSGLHLHDCRLGGGAAVAEGARGVLFACEVDGSIAVSRRAVAFDMVRCIVRGTVAFGMRSARDAQQSALLAAIGECASREEACVPTLLHNRVIGSVSHPKPGWMLDVTNVVVPDDGR